MALARQIQELECCICVNTYSNPVTIPCGHSFCRDCISKTWEQQGEGKTTCPMCQTVFEKRPQLKTSQVISSLMDHLQRPSLGEITTCTYCIRFPSPAIKFCRLCEASLCEDHLNVHKNSEEHVLLDYIPFLEDRKCSVHKRILEYYCCQDNVCVCVTCCIAGAHKQHQVWTIEDAYQNKKLYLLMWKESLHLQRDETERNCQSLKELGRKFQKRVSTSSQMVTSIFGELKDLEEKFLTIISMKEQEISLSVSSHIQQGEAVKRELSEKMLHIEELCNMTDPLDFLRESDNGNFYKSKEVNKVDPKKGADDLDEGLILATIYSDLSNIVNDAKRMFCGADCTDLVLDEHTAGNNVHVSGDQKIASWSPVDQRNPDKGKRYESGQVMCSPAFSSGRHYWEIETSVSGYWSIGLCYLSIDRKDTNSYFGERVNSWCLSRYTDWDPYYTVTHNREEDKLSQEPSCHKFGIYLDFEDGHLTFYELGDPIRHLHTYKATFTEPLHVVLRLWNSWVKICN